MVWKLKASGRSETPILGRGVFKSKTLCNPRRYFGFGEGTVESGERTLREGKTIVAGHATETQDYAQETARFALGGDGRL